MAEKQSIQHEFHLGIPGDAPTWAQQLDENLSYALRSIALRADLVILEGVEADKPTVEGSKRLYYATDSDTWYYDNGTAWKKIDHTTLANVGTNTHAQIDTHIASTSNPHNTLPNVTNDAQLKRAAGDFNTFTEKSSPVDADIVLIEDSASSYAKKKVQLSNISSDFPQVILEYYATAGSHGGGQSTGSWDTRYINREVLDTDNICSLSSNEFTLPAGTYDIDVCAAFFSTGHSRLRLYNVGATAVEQDEGSNDIVSLGTYSSGYAQTMGRINTRFTLTSQQALRVESRVTVANATSGWGAASNIGIEEKYLSIRLVKVA